MSTGNYNIRLDNDLKERAFSVIESYGLSPAQAIKLFLHQIADTRSIPLSFNHKQDYQPNALTQRAIAEARAELAGSKRYRDVEEALQAMRESADG